MAMKKLALVLAASFVAMPALAQEAPADSASAQRPVGEETRIPFADHGGLTDWRVGPSGSNTVLVRDRRGQWYSVTLNGPCVRDNGDLMLAYTTDPAGNFDRFSTVWTPGEPHVRFPVMHVRTAAAPADRHDDRDRHTVEPAPSAGPTPAPSPRS